MNSKLNQSAIAVDDQKEEKGSPAFSPSRLSQSNMTFLSGTGVFDWAQSTLMDDVLNNRHKFGMTEESDQQEGNLISISAIGKPVRDIFKEDEVFELIEQIKAGQKTLKDP